MADQVSQPQTYKTTGNNSYYTATMMVVKKKLEASRSAYSFTYSTFWSTSTNPNRLSLAKIYGIVLTTNTLLNRTARRLEWKA
jgi:ribosomal protein L33